MRVRHIPTRTCLGCGRKRAKHEMVRIVRTAEAAVEVDRTGKRAGRGGYLCPRPTCWETGILREGRLERLLRGAIAPESRKALMEHVQGMEGNKGESDDN